MNMNPHLDGSWVPDGLKAFVSGLGGMVLVALVAIFGIAAIVWAASKISGSFFVRNEQSGMRIVAVLLAAAMIGGIGQAAAWSVQNVNPIPGGISAAAGSNAVRADPALVAAVGSSAADSLARAGSSANQARRNWNQAKNDVSRGHIGQGLQHGAAATGNAFQSAGGAIEGGWRAVQHHGLWNTIRDGAGAIVDKGRQLVGWVAGKLGI